MAERANKEHQGDDGPTKGHNLGETKIRISEAMKTIFDKEQEIKKLVKLHVQDAKDDLAREWKNLKTDTNFDLKYLKAFYKPYQIANEARLLDEDERHDAMDAIRISYEAMAEGGCLDFIDILGQTPQEKKDKK